MNMVEAVGIEPTSGGQGQGQEASSCLTRRLLYPIRAPRINRPEAQRGGVERRGATTGILGPSYQTIASGNPARPQTWAVSLPQLGDSAKGEDTCPGSRASRAEAQAAPDGHEPMSPSNASRLNAEDMTLPICLPRPHDDWGVPRPTGFPGLPPAPDRPPVSNAAGALTLRRRFQAVTRPVG
jgi:hypothetical protein